MPNGKIFINSLNIVSATREYGGRCEDIPDMTFDKFYRIMSKVINKHNDNYSIRCSTDCSFFRVYYKGHYYTLHISPERLRNYQAGKYDEVTRKLHDLVSLSDRITKEDEIIDKIKEGTMEPSGENKNIYLSQLKREKSIINKKLIGTGALLSASPVNVAAAILTSETHPLWACLFLAVGFFSGCASVAFLVVKDLRIILTDGIRNKIVNHKALKLLRKQPGVEIKTNTDSLKNQQLASINNLVYMCQPLETEEKKAFLSRIRALLHEYTTTYKEVSTKEFDLANLDVMGEEAAFGAYITSKTIDLELEIIEALKKNEKVMAVIQDSNTIEDNIATLESGQALVQIR